MGNMTPEQHQVNSPQKHCGGGITAGPPKTKVIRLAKQCYNLLQGEPTAVWDDTLVLNEMLDLFAPKVDF